MWKIESVKTTSMEKDSTVVLGKNKALFDMWKFEVEIYVNTWA